MCILILIFIVILAAVPINLISTISIAEFLELLLPVYNPSSGSLRLLLLLLLPSLPPSLPLCNSQSEKRSAIIQHLGRNLSAQSSTKMLGFVFLKRTSHLTIIAVTIDMCWAEQVVNSTRILIKPRVLTLLTTSCCQKKGDTECPHSSVLTFPCRGLIL